MKPGILEGLGQHVKQSALEEDLKILQNVVKDAIGSLKAVTETTDLSEKIGVFARKMPELPILEERRVEFISLVRQVCTKEKSVEKGISLLEKEEAEINNALLSITR